MKHTAADRDPAALEKLRELIAGIEVAMITTVTPDGALRSRPMRTLRIGNEAGLWFATAGDSAKTHDIEAEHAVNVSYADAGNQRYVSVTGSATLEHDPDRAREFWSPALARFFSGPDDPQLVLLHVRVETAEFWDFSSAAAAAKTDGHAPLRHANKAPPGEHTKIDIRAARESG